MGVEEVSQHIRQKDQGGQKPRRKVESRPEVEEPHRGVREGVVGSSDMTAPKVRKRAQPKCSVCGSLEHNAKKMPL